MGGLQIVLTIVGILGALVLGFFIGMTLRKKQDEETFGNAKQEAKNLVSGAYSYSEEVMSTLQRELESSLKTIRSGRDAIRVHLPPPSIVDLQRGDSSEDD